MRIILPDDSVKIFQCEPSALEVAQSIGPRIARDTVGVKINGTKEIQDLRLPIKNGSRVELITLRSPEALEVIRHSAAHILAQAVQELWPEMKITIGPVIENGFYYDFDSSKTISEEDFSKIESKMREIVKEDLPITREEWPVDRAIKTFESMGEHFKVEIIRDLQVEKISIYYQGDWFDPCRGPHVQSTGQVKAFKLLSVAGAYWRGDEKNPMLQRVYATAFADERELEQHLKNLEEAKKRDHRKLGRELGLFTFHPMAPGSPFFTGKGSTIYTELQTYLRELYAVYGYKEVITPQLFDIELFKTSGHYDHYKESMFFSQADERNFGLKPMNCPSHCLLFASEKHSYRELPLRIADFGRLHRLELSGAVHGLTRVRTFCQDDAHIFCTLNQLQSEIKSFMGLLGEVYQKLGMDNFHVYLSTRPVKRMGDDNYWDQAEGALSEALKSLDLPFTFNPGDGAFYGPKLDIMFVDAIGRPYQLGTLQVDPNLPEVFHLRYTGEDNQEHKPIILHRAILGSLERFIGIYLEHTAGHLPPWLSPIQVMVLNVTDRVVLFCEEIERIFKQQKVRVEFDRRHEKLNYKIREAQLQKIPYMLIIGDKEVENNMVSLRLRTGETVNSLPLPSAVDLILKNIKDRSLQPTSQEVSH